MYNTSSEYRGLWHSIICPCDVLTIIKKRVPMDLFSSSLSQANSEHSLSYMNVNFHTVKKHWQREFLRCSQCQYCSHFTGNPLLCNLSTLELYLCALSVSQILQLGPRDLVNSFLNDGAMNHQNWCSLGIYLQGPCILIYMLLL